MAEILAAIDDSVEATFPEQVSWQAAMKRAIRSGVELCQHVQVPTALAHPAAEADFPVFVPVEYARRMQVGNPCDPLLRQVLGGPPETQYAADGLLDPVGDLAAERSPGLLQKYDRRVLLIATGACAVHCRYCFRRHFPYETAPRSQAGWLAALKTISDDPSLDEVILSGGDPLTLADSTLRWLVDQIGQIQHIRRLRIHTRVPVVIPQRVCEPLLAWVADSKLAIYFVLHFNHSAEIDVAVSQSLSRLLGAGATLLNQAVLLKGVNDSFEAQRDLCLKLVDRRVLPYYLHQLDPVQGALHFAVPDATALSIVSDLREHLPGYAVPKLVRETAGAASKTPL